MSLPCGAISQAFPLHIFILKQPSSTISVFQSKAGYTLKSLSLLKTCTCSRGSKILHGTYTCVVLTQLYLHVYFLHCSGVVHTCGLNDAHQLGLGTNPSSAPNNCLTPKPVSSRSSCWLLTGESLIISSHNEGSFTVYLDRGKRPWMKEHWDPFHPSTGVLKARKLSSLI